MIRQYPHFLFLKTTGESVQDDSGHWSDAEQRSELVSVCREETDGRGSEVQTADGTYRKFSSIIQLPKSDLGIKEGANVVVADDAEGISIRIEGVVLKFDKGQLHFRLWV